MISGGAGEFRTHLVNTHIQTDSYNVGWSYLGMKNNCPVESKSRIPRGSLWQVNIEDGRTSNIITNRFARYNPEKETVLWRRKNAYNQILLSIIKKE